MMNDYEPLKIDRWKVSPYKIEDEELQIYSCHIADLTLQQASSFLHMWEGGAKIGSLTLFFDMETGALVINRDHLNYELYIATAKKFLTASDEEIKDILENVPDGEKETIKVLENCRKVRHYKREIWMAENSRNITPDSWDVLRHLSSNKAPFDAMATAYSYGMMQGKRLERKKRKAARL